MVYRYNVSGLQSWNIRSFDGAEDPESSLCSIWNNEDWRGLEAFKLPWRILLLYISNVEHGVGILNFTLINTKWCRLKWSLQPPWRVLNFQLSQHVRTRRDYEHQTMKKHAAKYCDIAHFKLKHFSRPKCIVCWEVYTIEYCNNF